MAALPDGLFGCISVKPFGSHVPEFDHPIQTPGKHRLVGQHEQIGQAFGGLEGHLASTLRAALAFE